MVAFFGTIGSTWSLFLVPKFQSLPPPKKKKTHKLIVPCAEVWEKWLKVLIWDRDAVYWTFWRDLSIQGSLILKHTHGCAILNVFLLVRSWLTNPTPKSRSSFNHVTYQLCQWDPWHEPCADLSFRNCSRNRSPSDMVKKIHIIDNLYICHLQLIGQILSMNRYAN